MEGGSRFLRHLSSSQCEPLRISFTARGDAGGLFGRLNQIARYEMTVEFAGERPTVAHERITLTDGGSGENVVDRVGDHVNLFSSGEPLPQFSFIKDLYSRYDWADTLLLGDSGPLCPHLSGAVKSFAAFDIEPGSSKFAAVPIAGKSELQEDGGNLAIALHRILRDADDRRKLTNFLHDLFPFVDSVESEPLFDRSMFFKVVEKWSAEALPGSLMCNGTVALLATIVALYFERRPLIALEEPERHVHPGLLSRLMNMFRDASLSKQLLITTHSAELVRHASLDEVLLISRESDGYSIVTIPKDDEQIKTFLEEEIGLGDLFVMNLLTV